MSIAATSYPLLPIKQLQGCRIKSTTYTPSRLSVKGFQSFSYVEMQHHSRYSVRTKAGGSQEGPQDNSYTKAEDPVTTTNQADNSSRSVLSFLCPLLKLVAAKDPSLPRNDTFEVLTSGLASISRLPWGSQALPDVVTVREGRGQPMRLLQLYEFVLERLPELGTNVLLQSIFYCITASYIEVATSYQEACPFCRRVREALTELDLPAEVYPCPKGSLIHRDLVRSSGGKEQFPYLVDPNTGVSLYESGDIVKYLFQQYGEGRGPSLGLLESTLFTGWIPTIIRAGRGMTLWERAKPETAAKRLELFSYENNQNARLVREALCELELPYILHNVGKGSSRTKILLQLAGSEKVPYLIDPNTGLSFGDHKEIISYLFQTYSRI